MSTLRRWEAKMLPGVWKDSVNVELEKHSRQGWELVAVLPGKEDPVSYTHLTLPTIYSV